MAIENILKVFAIDFMGIGAGAYLFYKGFFWLNRKKLIENLPTSKIRSAAMGLVEIKGKAKPAVAEIRKSPLTGRDCVYYKYLVEKLVSSGKSSHWVPVRQEYSPEPFFVEDSTGKVLVDPKFAELKVNASYDRESKWGKDPEPAVAKFLAKNKIRFEDRIFGANYTMRYREWVITPNMELYILGEASKNPYVESGTAKSSAENIIIKKGIDRIMIISAHKEHELAFNLHAKAIAGIAGGASLMVICISVMIALLSL